MSGEISEEFFERLKQVFEALPISAALALDPAGENIILNGAARVVSTYLAIRTCPSACPRLNGPLHSVISWKDAKFKRMWLLYSAPSWRIARSVLLTLPSNAGTVI
jgi:hypothetical protein